MITNQRSSFKRLEGSSGFFTILTHSHADGQSCMNIEWIYEVYRHNQPQPPVIIWRPLVRRWLRTNVGWLCLTSHRQRGHLETAPPFTVPCEGREARYIHRSDRELNPGPSHCSPLRYRCATQASPELMYGGRNCSWF